MSSNKSELHVCAKRGKGRAYQGNINILSYSDYTDNIGYQHIIGEIQNNSTTTQGDIKIVATFYDSNNQFATSSYIYSEILSNIRDRHGWQYSSRKQRYSQHNCHNVYHHEK